jgi:hypothetical protein
VMTYVAPKIPKKKFLTNEMDCGIIEV